MITKTSLSAIRTLLYISRRDDGDSLSPRKIAEELKESPTYMAKVTRHLVKAGILRAEKGVKGGVRLSRQPKDITMLEVVQACQGTLVGDYCQAVCDHASVCAYHRAAEELHTAISGVLSRWTLAQLLKKPGADGKKANAVDCVILNGVSPAIFLAPGVKSLLAKG
jgi:Rrf2 family protein